MPGEPMLFHGQEWGESAPRRTNERNTLHWDLLDTPEGAALQNVTINGVQQPIRQEGRVVSVPLTPGSQSVKLEWRETDGMGFTEDGYGGISPACSSCGTSDEYAVPYPCPTVTAIRRYLGDDL